MITGSLTPYDYVSLKRSWERERLFVTLVSTPICGNCQVARKMLGVIHAASPEIPMGEVNLNLNEDLARDLAIMSVPCVLIHREGACVEQVYALHSVPHLYNLIKSGVRL